MIQSLAVNQTPVGMTTDSDEPSLMQIAAPGDYLITYEIVDEQHVVRIIEIEE
ncbi:MAG: hypothetical protein U0175_12965 [Caldilineaceae bacterium]